MFHADNASNTPIPVPNQQVGGSPAAAEHAVEQTSGPAPLLVDGFPMLLKHARSPSRATAAIEAIAHGVRAGSIRNTVLVDAKFDLSRVVEDAWSKEVGEPFVHGKRDQLDAVALALYDSIMIMGLHDVISASKKVAKTMAGGPLVDAMRAYCAEVLPLSLAVAALKDKVVKGRAPRTQPAKPVNPNKIVKTCGVCFRQIAVDPHGSGTMVHHGYERPGHGSQTSSCAGIRFKPLEVSPEGLAWLVGKLERDLETTERAYANRATLPTAMFVQVGRSIRDAKMVSITRDDPRWKKVFDAEVWRWESDIRRLKRDIPPLKKRLVEWKPGVQL